MAARRPPPEGALLSPPERHWLAAVGLGWPPALVAAPIIVSLGDLPLCGFRHLSGLPCPLCGATHACTALLQGDPAAAWQANPGLLPVLTVAALHTGFLAWEAASGRRRGPPQFWSVAWAAAGATLLGAWGLRLAGYL